MRVNRRIFLSAAATLGGTTVLKIPSPNRSLPLDGEALLDRMYWFNHPASSKQTGAQLVVTSKPGSDFWRKTFYNYTADSGHFFYLDASGDFVFEGRVRGRYESLYDQAGLMVRLDGENWLKCGLVLIIGLIWSTWHIWEVITPGGLSLMSTTDIVVITYMRLTATAVIYAWIYNSTKGSLFLVMVAHAGHNLAGQLIQLPAGGAVISSVGYVVIAIVIVLMTDPRTFMRKRERPAAATT
jgi:hypothetical protein